MNISRRRVRAIVRKELREYRRNGNIVIAMAILPLVFMIQPLVGVFTLPDSASVALHREHTLLYLLAIPVLVPAALSAYAIVGERLQGTLEPVLATPIRREELLLGKALAAFVPSVAVAYLVFALYVAVVELFAHAVVAGALVQASELLVQLIFTPLLAAWSIWVGMGISARARDPADRARVRRRADRTQSHRLARHLGHLRPRTTHQQHQMTRVRGRSTVRCNGARIRPD